MQACNCGKADCSGGERSNECKEPSRDQQTAQVESGPESKAKKGRSRPAVKEPTALEESSDIVDGAVFGHSGGQDDRRFDWHFAIRVGCAC